MAEIVKNLSEQLQQVQLQLAEQQTTITEQQATITEQQSIFAERARQIGALTKTDVEQAYAVGQAAVEMAIAGKNGVMPAIIRGSGEQYSWTIEEAPLDQVANVEKKMPRDYISDDGYGITEKGRAYLSPLIQGNDYPPYNENGLPDYARLKKVLAAKKVNVDFDI